MDKIVLNDDAALSVIRSYKSISGIYMHSKSIIDMSAFITTFRQHFLSKIDTFSKASYVDKWVMRFSVSQRRSLNIISLWEYGSYIATQS